MMETERAIHPGDIFRHFKDKLYQIVAIAYHSETKEKMVVYQALYDDFKVYVRPYDMFMSEVDHEKYPEVKEKFRFTKCNAKPGSEPVDVPVSGIVDECDGVNPLLMGFFERETSAEKIEFICENRSKLDDRIVSDMAVSMDITIDDGELDTKIDSLLSCLKTKAKYECSRFR